jgi:hypothetical protein
MVELKTMSLHLGAQSTRWKKPIHNFLKINFDASFSEQTFSGGWDFVITNEIGDAVAAWAH